MDKLITLLTLQRQALESSSQTQLLHIMLNETLRLIPYQQAVYWSYNGDIVLERASGNSEIENKSAYAEELAARIKPHLSSNSFISPLGDTSTLVLLKSPKDGVIGGLWLDHKTPPHEAELKLLEELSLTYAAALNLHHYQSYNGFLKLAKNSLMKYRLIYLGLFIAALFPVRLSVSAPAEIIAANTTMITIPYDGTIDKVLITPGATVTKDTPLLQMEKTGIDANADIAESALNAAEAQLARLQRQVLSSPEKQADLNTLEAEIKQKTIEYRYALNKQQEGIIKSPISGVAVFSDASKLEGKPARTGEVAMQIADPETAELLISVPAPAMLDIKPGDDVSFYLNLSPLSSGAAIVKTVGYQASLDANQLLTYKIRAVIKDKQALRIGWRGNARIKTEWTVLSYSLLRRPLLALRQISGV